MDTEASRVVVALIGDTADLDGRVTASTRVFDRNMTEIERSASEAEGVVRSSMHGIAEASGNTGASQLILQSIIRRTTDQFAAGAPVSQIFAEHVSGLSEAAALAGGSFGKFGEILAGPWGLALSAGVSILAILVQKHFEASDATDAHAKAAKNLTDAFDELNKVTGQSVRLHDEEALAQAQAAAKTYEHTRAIRDQTKAQLEQAIATEKASATVGGLGGGSGGANLTQVGAQNKVSDLQQQLAENNAAVARDAKSYLEGFRGLRADQILTGIKNSTDAVAGATDRYDHTIRHLRDQLAAGSISEKEFTDRALSAKNALDAAKDSATHHARAHDDSARAAREAAAAERDLETSLANLQKRYDPVAAAAAAYLDALKDISNLEATHKIDADTAALYRQQAAFENIADTQAGLLKQQKEQHDAIFGGNDGSFGPAKFDTASTNKQLAEMVENGPFGSKTFQEQQRNVQSLADLYQRAFSGGTQSIWKTFKKEGEKEIAFLLAKLTILQITQGGSFFKNASSVFSSAGSAGSGDPLSSFFSAFGKKASGGYVGPGSISRVNEQGGGVELLRMGPQGGTVIPLGSARAAGPGRGTTVIQHISVDGRNSVTPADFAAQIVGTANDLANQMDERRQSATLGATSGAVRRTQVLQG